MKRKGYRYRCPKQDLGHLQDKEAKAQATELLEALKKKVIGEDFEFIFVDETTLTLDPLLRACWMKVGTQKRVPATRPGEKQKRHVFGGYNCAKDTIIWTTALIKNTATFIVFLEELLIKRYPTGRIVLVMDNVSYHKSASALAALSVFEHRVMVIWLPTYCSDLNLIERFWRYLKDQACANHLEDSLACVLELAERTITHQNQPDAVNRFHVSKIL